MKLEIVTPDEWNNLIYNFKRAHIPYGLSINTTYVEARLDNGRKVQAFFNGQVKGVVNNGAIGGQFAKQANFHRITEGYGRKEYWSNTAHKFKVKWNYKTAKGFTYIDEYYADKELKCWSYDVSSSYAFAMLNPMPDTTKEPRYNDRVRKNEIGFYKEGTATDEPGVYADIIFPLMDSPFKDYVMNYYHKKEKATEENNKLERDKWKAFLNIPTGLLQKYNIFLRNAIVYYSNQYIKKFFDDNTIYCNTDSIVSLTPRPDIPIGNDIGQFKSEHNGESFKYKQEGIYQWSKECHYKGVTGENITDIDDISDWRDNFEYKLEGELLVKNEKKKR